ncbi:MAG: hypothetical protein JSS97_14960 [Actinobacteria bacterium]|nr:hypothetical protein [Actinomycetota bacterium]
MELRIRNPDPRYAPPALGEPPRTGWLYIAASVAPPSGPPFVRRDAARSALLAQLSALAEEARVLPEVLRVSVYRAVLIAPVGREVSRPARFDVAVLVETASPELLATVRDAPPIARMPAAANDAGSVQVMAARCARFLGPVDRTRQGLFLFNHFAAADDEVDLSVALSLWEHLAAWYAAETGLDNSTLLVPTGESDHLMVNHARWDIGLPRLAAAQFLKPSFRGYVQANLRAHHLVAMPALYRLVWPRPISQENPTDPGSNR